MATKRGLLDFGAHGRQAIRHEGPAGRHKRRKVREYFTGKGKPDDFEFSPEQSREATNYLKAVDRRANRSDWKDGGSSFLQGAASDYSDHSDPIIRDAERRRKKGQEASMADFGDEEGGGFWNEVGGLFDSDSIGTEEEEVYRDDSDHEGESRYLNKLAREERGYGSMEDYDDDLGSVVPTWREDTEGESALDRIGRENRGRSAAMADFKGEEEGSTWDSIKGLFASDSIESDSDGGFAASMSSGKDGKLSPMQKYGAELIMDVFGEKEQAPMQVASVVPLTPGRSLDMSKYSSARPKKDRYRNMGLLGRA